MWTRTVRCLVRLKLRQIAPALPGGAGAVAEREADAVQYVVDSLAGLPAFLRLPLQLLCLGLSFYLPSLERVSADCLRLRLLRFLPGIGLLHRFVGSLVVLRAFDPAALPARGAAHG